MLRTIFVTILMLIGITASFYGAFNALLFYLWVAYFRPTSWMWGGGFLTSLRFSLWIGMFLIISTIFTGVKLRFTLFAGLLSLTAIHSLITILRSDYNGIVFSYLRAQSSGTLFSYWVDFAQVIVISYFITMLVRSEKNLRLTLIVMSLSFGLEGAKQGWASLILHPGSINTNTQVVFGDNNGVAVGMLMIAPMLLALYQTTERKFIKYGFLFLAIGVTYRALSTYSRGGFLTFITMCAIFWLRSKHKIKSLFVIVLLLALLLPTLPQAFWDRMDTINVSEGEERESSSASRIYFWRVAWEMAKSSPLFGIGHMAYAQAYDSFDSYDGRYGHGRSVHSAWFGVLAEWGIPGLILFLCIYFYSIFSCVRARKKCKADPELKSFGIYISSIETSLIACGVGISFLTFQYLEMLWHLFALAIVCNQILPDQNMTKDDLPENAGKGTGLPGRKDMVLNGAAY